MRSTPNEAIADSLEEFIAMQVGRQALSSVSVEWFPIGSPRTSPTVKHHAVMKVFRGSQSPVVIHIECRPSDEAHYISRTVGLSDPEINDEYWVTMNTLLETWQFIVSLCDELGAPSVHCSMFLCRRSQSTFAHEWLDRQVQWCQSNTPLTDHIRLALIERTLGTPSLMMECLSHESQTIARIFLDINTASEGSRSYAPRTSHHRRAGQLPQLFIVCHSFEETWQLSCLIAEALKISTMTLEQVPA